MALVTLGRGAAERTTSRISGLGARVLVVTPVPERRGTTRRTTPLSVADVQAIVRAVPHVDAVAPSASRELRLSHGGQSWSTLVVGVSPDYARIRGLRAHWGRLFSETDLQSGALACVLGGTPARQLFGSRNPVGAAVRLRRSSCTVVGVMAAKGSTSLGEDQDNTVLVPITAYARRIAGSRALDSITLRAVSDAHVEGVKRDAEKLLRQRRKTRGGEDSFTVHDMREVVTTFRAVAATLTALLGAVATVSLFVGGIGIMNVMVVTVTERTREIGVRLAVGARAYEIMLQFIVEAVLLSLVGACAGVVLGLVTSLLASRVLDLPFAIFFDVLALSVGFASLVGLVFGMGPALRACRLDPVEALRHE